MFKQALFQSSAEEFLAGQIAKLKADIWAAQSDYLLRVDEEEYLSHIVETYKLPEFIVDEEVVSVGTKEKKGNSYTDSFGDIRTPDIVQYDFEIAYDGIEQFWELRPSTSRSLGLEASILDEHIRFSIDDYGDYSGRLKSELDRTVEDLRFNANNVNSQCQGWNLKLEDAARGLIKRRKEELLKMSDTLSSLGVSIKKKDEIPQTASVPLKPLARKTIQPRRPTTGLVKPSVPDPSLSEEMYLDIIDTTHGVGKVIERLPSIYLGRNENDIRDLFLLYLEPRYTESGGETFNGSGKTDILIRHGNSNLFIAEFKFWSGIKAFGDAIDQLFGYLTWRDSKAAIIVLNRNHDHTSVVDLILKRLKSHNQFVELKSIIDETWLNLTMRFPSDKSKIVHLAVQVFHTPDKIGLQADNNELPNSAPTEVS